MKTEAHSEKFNEYITIRIFFDEDPVNPCVDYDNAGTMVCWHNRYNLGDEQPGGTPTEYLMQLAIDALGSDEALARKYRAEGETWGDAECIADWALQERIEANPDPLNRVLESHYLILPLYLYDHSGLSMSCSSFSCPWDSGQVGFIYISKAEAVKEWGKTRFTKQVCKRAEAYLRGRVESYDDYLTGQCFGYAIDTDQDEYVDSCWGFLGDQSYCLEEARAAAAWVWKDRRCELIREAIAARFAYLQSLEDWARTYAESRPDMYPAC